MLVIWTRSQTHWRWWEIHQVLHIPLNKVNKCWVGVEVWECSVLPVHLHSRAHVHSYAAACICVCPQFAHTAATVSLQGIWVLFGFNLLLDGFRACFSWRLVQRRKCGGCWCAVRWFVLRWGEGIDDPKWSHLKSTKKGDTAGNHHLVCFPFLDVNKPEWITFSWSQCTVMKSSWKHNSVSSESTWLWSWLQSFPSSDETTKSPESDLSSKDLHWILLSLRITYTIHVLLFPPPLTSVIVPAF